MTRILGIDPGSISGAWAVIDPVTGLLEVDDVPVLNKQVDASEWARLVKYWTPDVAVIELVSVMPKQGIASGFRFGKACGILSGVVSALGVPLHEVTPGKWKRYFNLDSDAEKSRALASRLFPVCSKLARKRDHNRSEAILIARWYEETHK